jgi:hypothetical protein
MLKLQPLPDRVPVKLTITILPHLKKALDDYARLYAKTYGAEEPVSELVPFMIEGFLNGDTVFKKARKDLDAEPLALPLTAKRPRTKRTDASNEEGETP